MKMLVAKWPALVFPISPAYALWRVSSRSSKVLSRVFLHWLLPLIVLSQCLNAKAQQTDVTLAPNVENAGINKSLEEQIGPGRGDVMMPGSSRFLINRDPFRAIARGRELFQRKFTVSQGFGPRTGDGVGNIGFDPSLGAGLADSCAACHGRPPGSAGFGGQVFTRPDSRDAPHLFGLGIIEMLADQITFELRQLRTRAIKEAQRHRTLVTVNLRSKGVDYGQLTAFPDGSTDTSQVESIDPDLRVKPFFAEGSSFSIREFIVGALNNEMGLEAPDPDLLTASGGEKVVTPTGMVLDGSLDVIPAPPVQNAGDDADGDGVVNEIPTSLLTVRSFTEPLPRK